MNTLTSYISYGKLNLLKNGLIIELLKDKLKHIKNFKRLVEQKFIQIKSLETMEKINSRKKSSYWLMTEET